MVISYNCNNYIFIEEQLLMLKIGSLMNPRTVKFKIIRLLNKIFHIRVNNLNS